MSNNDWNQHLTEITLPEYVTEVDSYLFCNYPNLRKVTLPDSITKIGAYAFAQCTSLSEIVIPEAVHVIENHAFADCTSLTSVYLPSNLTVIEDGIFSGCHNLSECRIPNSVTKIGREAFEGCTSLKHIDIPESIVSLEEKAFSGCNGLNVVYVPKTVESIRDSCFSNCSNLRDIQIINPTTIFGTDVFLGCDSLVIHCPLSSSALYYALSSYILFIPDVISINTIDFIPTFESRDYAGDGWSWNEEQKLLTLENYDGGAIVSGVSLDLELKPSSQNYISSKDLESERAGIFVLDGDMSISGSGKLTVENFGKGIHVNDSITVHSGDVVVIGRKQGVCSVYGDVDISGGVVYAVALDEGNSSAGIFGRLRSGNARIFASDDKKSLDEVKQYLHQKYVCISHDETYLPNTPLSVTQVIYNIGQNSEVVIGDNYGTIIGHDAVLNRSTLGNICHYDDNDNISIDNNNITVGQFTKHGVNHTDRIGGKK